MKKVEKSAILYWIGGLLFLFLVVLCLRPRNIATAAETEPEKITASPYYYFKIDLADVYGAGIEHYAFEKDTLVKKLEIKDKLEFVVSYRSIYGEEKTVSYDALKEYLQVLTKEKEIADSYVAAFAGQGESVIFVSQIPDVKEFLEAGITYKASEDKYKAEEKLAIAGIQIYSLETDQGMILKKQEDERCLNARMVEGLAPVSYYTSDTYNGMELISDMEKKVKFLEYLEDASLEPVDVTRFLLQFDTAAECVMAKIPEITMQISYETIAGKIAHTDQLLLRDVIKDYYGYDPGGFSYERGLSGGNKLYGIISINDVKTFTGVTFGIQDKKIRWQMDGFCIYKIDDISKRLIRMVQQPGAKEGEKVRSYYRNLNEDATLLFRSSTMVTVKNAASKTLNFISDRVKNKKTKKTDLGKSTIKGLDYKTAMSGLSFCTEAASYVVNVTVADSSDGNIQDEDSGSNNNFYFQLVFENGTSAYVLANEQMEGDGFKAGKTSAFTISVNQDYGELKAIRVLPEIQSEKMQPFDKLNIHRIDIEKQGGGRWSTQQVGWIGVAETASTFENVAQTFYVGEQNVSANILFAITAGVYEEQGMGSFVGAITGDIHYIDTSGNSKVKTIPDVVKLIYEYNGKVGECSYDSMGRAISDPNLMFRENHVDRFLVSFDNINELQKMELHFYTQEKKALKIKSVSAALVSETGKLLTNSKEECERTDTVLQITENVEEIPLILTSEDAGLATVTISFLSTESNLLQSSSENVWACTVSNESISENDSINLYVYVADENYKYQGEELVASIDYSDSFGGRYQRQHSLQYHEKEDGGNAYFYAADISMTGVAVLDRVGLSSQSKESIPLAYAIVQQIRAGSIIETYQLDFQGMDVSTSPSASVHAMTDAKQQCEVVTIGFSQAMETVFLEEGQENVEVAVQYTLENHPAGQTYTSEYVALTQQQLSQVAGGTVVELRYQIPFIKEITGLQLRTRKGAELRVENACAGVYALNSDATLGELKDWYNLEPSQEQANNAGECFLQVISSERANAETVVPVNVILETGTDEILGAGTTGPIRMSVTYLDREENQNTVVYADVRRLLKSGDFESDSIANIQFLLKGVKHITQISLEPYSVSGETEVWKLGRISLSYNMMTDAPQQAAVTVNDYIYEGNPKIISFVNAIITGTVEWKGQTAQLLNNTVECTVGDGEKVSIFANVLNSSQGMKVVCNQIIGDIHQDMTEECIRFEDNKCNFYAPESSTTANERYEIQFTAVENPDVEATVFVIVQKN